jgi:ribosome maturation factor RimP
VSVGTGTRPLTEAIETLAAPVIRAHGLILVDVDLRGSGRRSVLRFFIDRPGGVSISDCQRFSAEIGDLLDAENLLPESYDLEVSSPGLDRELKKDRELRWAMGRQVRVFAREPVEGQREFVGRLREVAEGFLTLAEASGPRQIPRALLTKVRLEVEPVRSA